MCIMSWMIAICANASQSVDEGACRVIEGRECLSLKNVP